MAQKPIREITAKSHFTELYHSFLDDSESAILCNSIPAEIKNGTVTIGGVIDQSKRYVIKPDMLFGKRGQHKLVAVNVEAADVISTLQSFHKEVTIDSKKDILDYFIIDEMYPHLQEEEHYLSIETSILGDIIRYSPQGGMNIEDNWDSITTVVVAANQSTQEAYSLIKKTLKTHHTDIVNFVYKTLMVFRKGGYSYLEFNPFCIDASGFIHLLDAVARVDDQEDQWLNFEFPRQFGQLLHTEEEKAISSLDAKSGSSLKMTCISPDGSIWNLLAGGGASVVFLDQLCEKYPIEAIGNYGEYSGNPTLDEVYEYTCNILTVMLRSKAPYLTLCIVGATANFTQIDVTFKGISQALQSYAQELQQRKVSVIVRRGGPKQKEGLAIIKQTLQDLNLPFHVFGPELPIAQIMDYLPDSIILK